MVRFAISAEVSDDIVLRMLNFFAQRGLRPLRIHAEQADNMMSIQIDQHDIDAQTASVIGEKMRNCIHVTKVVVEKRATV
jgi:hypothetical protein